MQRFPLARSLMLIASHSRLLLRGVELMRAAATEFFLPQYETRLFPGLRPVVTLVHPLDELMPFRPHRLRRYLGYLGVFLKTLGFIHQTCGPDAWRDMARMFRELCRLYYLSGSVYRRCQSTTAHRLPLVANPYGLLIRLFDPHLHCVPSLHILAVCYNYWAARQALGRRLPADHPAVACTEELFDIAVYITETVLLVKQHSVMDIAPTLFLLSQTFPGYDEAEVRRLVGALFRAPAAFALREEVLRSYLELSGRAAREGREAREARASRASRPDPVTLVVEYLWSHAVVRQLPETRGAGVVVDSSPPEGILPGGGAQQLPA